MAVKNKKPISEYDGLMPITKISFKDRFKGFLQRYNFKHMQSIIAEYGYEYSFKKFFFGCVFLALCLGAIAIYVKLDIYYVTLLVMLGIGMFPIIIQAQFEQMYQMKRFDMIASYLDNALPIFKKTPIITYTWRECIDLLDGEMRDCVQEAYNLIMTNVKDPHVLQSAFLIIEKRFPNSRIHSVHQMMYSVVTKNTQNYSTSVDNMWYDVQAWISRVGVFRRDLKRRKMDLLILSVLTAGLNCLFVAMYSSSEIFAGFTNHYIYQLSTTAFFAALMLVMLTFHIRLHGKWMLDDASIAINKKAFRGFKKIVVAGKTDKILIKDIVLGLVVVALGAGVYYYTKNPVFLILFSLMGYLLYSQNRREYKIHFNNLKNFLTIEFPTWLRGITINLYDLTVVNAIKASKETSSVILNYYIDGFLDEFFENPASIKPYNNFLTEYHIEGIRPAMKVLFSMQASATKDDVIVQTSDLIIRNQEMLAKAERMKNDYALGGLKLLGFIPVAMLVAKMLIDMGLMFVTMFELMSTTIAL